MVFDHISIGVDNIEKAGDFYDKVLETINIKRLATMDALVAYGKDSIQFLAMLPYNKQQATHGNGVHIAFTAQNNQQVDAFYNTALKNGGSDEGAPGARPYPHREVYTAYLRDPFGNKLEIIAGGFASA